MPSLFIRTCLLLALFCVSTVNAQKYSYKWGKPTDDEKELKVCPFDSTASVVMLDESGNVEFGFGSGFVTIHKYFKMKILDERGLEAATIRLPFYTKDGFEKITNMRAQTLNFSNGGKVEATRVESDQFFEFDTDNEWKEIRFTFPSVSPGSILEYSYTLSSKSYTFLEGWVFQNPYPTLHSKFSAMIAEGLDYRVIYQGKNLIAKYNNGTQQNEWELYYQPALKEEPYCHNIMDYAEAIKFQLVGYKKVGIRGDVEDVKTLYTWESVISEVMESESYFDYLKDKIFAEKNLKSVAISDSMSERNKAKAIYDYVLKTLKWNREYHLFPLHHAGQLMGFREGCSADISLLLYSLMKAAGLNVGLMMVSTKDNGEVFKDCILASQFNSVVVHLNLDGRDYYIDGTEPNRPLSLPPSVFLNTTGLMLDKRAVIWKEINSIYSSRITSLVSMVVGNTDSTGFNIDLKFEDYSALKYRDMLEKSGKKETVRSILGENNTMMNIAGIEVSNEEKAELPLLIQVKGSTNHLVNPAGRMLYLTPLIIPRLAKNPFTSATRVYPVDFDYKEITRTILKIRFADGIVPVDIPADINWTLPDKSVSFIYKGQNTQEELTLTSLYEIRDPMIKPDQYPALKRLMGNILEKLNQPVVCSLPESGN